MPNKHYSTAYVLLPPLSLAHPAPKAAPSILSNTPTTGSPLPPRREISEELISGGMESRNSQRSWRREIGAGASFIGQGLTEGWQWVEANHRLTSDRDNKVSLWARAEQGRVTDRQASRRKKKGKRKRRRKIEGAVLWPRQAARSQSWELRLASPVKAHLLIPYVTAPGELVVQFHHVSHSEKKKKNLIKVYLQMY